MHIQKIKLLLIIGLLCFTLIGCSSNTKSKTTKKKEAATETTKKKNFKNEIVKKNVEDKDHVQWLDLDKFHITNRELSKLRNAIIKWNREELGYKLQVVEPWRESPISDTDFMLKLTFYNYSLVVKVHKDNDSNFTIKYFKDMNEIQMENEKKKGDYDLTLPPD